MVGDPALKKTPRRGKASRSLFPHIAKKLAAPKINQGDTVEVWGMGQGVSSGQNAFGGTVQEAWVQVAYINDQTTGYQK